MKKLIFLFLLFIFCTNTFALSKVRAELFCEAYIHQFTNLKNFIHPQEISRCNRLGISYESIDLKCFISYLLPLEIQNKSENLSYRCEIENIDQEYDIIKLSIPDENYEEQLYFKDNLYISPISFHTRNWPIIESEYFRFIVSNDSLINEYSIRNLENFLLRTMNLLDLSENERNLLKQEKIDYVLCKDVAEIEKLTGFNTRGIYLLAQDCVVSIFNSHYHELAHLLINFKLKNLPLFTNPFLQEGFAVSVGGRGGKEPDVILDMGKFLVDNDLLNYTDLLSKTDFYNVDATLSYPLSGLYNRFLINEIGIEKYLELYRKYSASITDFPAINSDDLPNENEWKSYLRGLILSSVWLQDNADYEIIKDSEDFILAESYENYCIKVKGSILLKTDDEFSTYKSTLFQQKFPNLEYIGEKYLIAVSNDEVMIYNLFTNTLIANYSSGFTLDFQLVPKIDEFYKFYISKEILDDSIEKMIILYNKFNEKE